MGKSSSGKDTIFKELQRQGEDSAAGGLECSVIVPYTTRPIRAGEQDGVEYFFTDEAEFQKLQAAGKVIEHREYDTVHGLWRYFTVDDGQFHPEGEQDYIMIGTLEGCRSLRNYFGAEKVLPVLIELDDGERLQRALERERQQEHPKYEELCRRFLADSADFAEENILEAGVERRFRNDDLKRCLEEIISYIKSR